MLFALSNENNGKFNLEFRIKWVEGVSAMRGLMIINSLVNFKSSINTTNNYKNTNNIHKIKFIKIPNGFCIADPSFEGMLIIIHVINSRINPK
jgi:hypothetical protein